MLYAIGWFTLFSSAAITSLHLIGLYKALNGLAQAGRTGPAARAVLDAVSDPTATAYVLVMNVGLWLLLGGTFAFLFFWKPPPEPVKRG